MKGLIILADGFEDVEAIATIDVLRRSKINVDVVTINKNLFVESAHNIVVKAEKEWKKVTEKDYDFLVIPGGRAVYSVWDQFAPLTNLINQFVSSQKLVAAICAGPALVGKLGHYHNHSYTCFPGSEKTIVGGQYLPKESVVRDGNFITAKAMAFTFEFSLAIIEFLQGKEQKEQVRRNIRGEL
ncbi:MAG TPA: DJ-1/PfpI family protein [Bacilli bacterium]|nr:MAG: Chaperone protein YajL [Tenericutes bacterium ADurb.BinA124]HNZ50304.1 DJ-1/PfpI family protein [Bacilli bacterium]HPX83663.1 DJ-1/PfpI family protein [Bacilli bacterium]HQC74266.1 DJ-1/PfpI family protein [Bacilli bacterium]